MFRVIVQEKKRNGEYVTDRQAMVEHFDESLASTAKAYAETKGLFCQMYVGHDDPVPVGYSSKKLEYTTCIWKTSEPVSVTEAMKVFTF